MNRFPLRRALCLEGILGLIAWSAAVGVEVPVHVEGLAPEIAVSVTASRGGSPRDAVSARRTVDGYLLSLSPGVWEVTAVAPPVWFDPAPVVVENEATPSAVILRARPGASLRGTLATDRPGQPFGDFRLSFKEAGRAENRLDWDGDARCKVEAAGEFACQVPAGVLDLRLQLRGFVPRYLWQASLNPNDDRVLGRVALRQGASVAGWVVVADRGVSPSGARVGLSPATAAAGMEPPGAKLAKLTLQTATSREGFFQFEGVAPGGYLITVEKPPYLPAEARVQVLEGFEARLREPLLLQRPADLEVFVDPPHRSDGTGWRLRFLRRRGGQVIQAREVPVELSGSASVEDLAAGQYSIQVLDASGAAWFADTTWEFAADGAPLFLTIPLVRVAGVVTLGEDPLPAATITFGGRDGPIRVPLTADDRGAFEAEIPRAGTWVVQVRAPEPSVDRTLRAVLVPRPIKGLSRVEIHLPNQRILGRVVDANTEAAVEKAIVSVNSGESPELVATVESAEGGSFEVDALGEGKYFVSAKSKSARSQLELVDLGKGDGEESEVVLRLRPVRRRMLEVRSTFGAIPGARVAIRSDDRIAEGDSLYRTGVDGEVEFEVDERTRRVSVDVGAPGFAFWTGAFDLWNEAPLLVSVDQISGTLVLDLSDLAETEAIVGEVPVLVHGGGFTWPLGLRPWATLNGAPSAPGPFVVPAMPGGRYALCRLPIAAAGSLGAIAQGGGAGALCNSGILVPGSELRLSLPVHR